jgi:hypothetical protein
VSAWLSFAAAVSSADTAASIIAFNGIPCIFCVTECTFSSHSCAAWASLSANDRTTALSPSLDNTSSQNHIEVISCTSSHPRCFSHRCITHRCITHSFCTAPPISSLIALCRLSRLSFSAIPHPLPTSSAVP